MDGTGKLGYTVTPSIGVSIDDLRAPNRILLWRTSILSLAIRRTAPLLAASGLPLPIAERPQLLATATGQVIRKIDTEILGATVTVAKGEPQLNESTAVVIAERLEQWVAELQTAYGRHAVLDLLAWLMRNEIDWQAREENWAWWQWISKVARHEAQLPLLGGSSRGELWNLVQAAYAAAKAADYRTLEELAEAVPLSGPEEALLRQWRDQDGSEASSDVVGWLRLARLREIARGASTLIRAATNDSDWSEIIAAVGYPSRRSP